MRLIHASLKAALYTHFFTLDFGEGVSHAPEMDKPVIVCGKRFSVELITHLNETLQEDPKQPRSALARVICQALNWFSSDGRPALSSARVALRKLEKRGWL